jgi:hypothetical protein
MAKGRKTGGRKKGTPNKRQELQEFIDDVFGRADPVQLATKLLRAKAPSERLLIRLLEYRFGRPPLSTEGQITMPKIIDVSVMRSRRSKPGPFSSAATNPSPSVNKENPISPEPIPVVQNSPTCPPAIPLIRKRVFQAHLKRSSLRPCKIGY